LELNVASKGRNFSTSASASETEADDSAKNVSSEEIKLMNE
jgi:hypothetical protein